MSYTYDLLDQRTSETDSAGRVVRYEYYPNGNLYKITYPDGTGELYTYDRSWRVIGVTDTRGSTTSYAYDAMGNRTMVRDALGGTAYYEYDILGRLTKETDRNGSATAYTYDGAGNCISMTNALGTTMHMKYDALGRMTGACITAEDGTEYRTSYTYDALGRMVSATDGEGNTSHIQYDAAGNVTGVTDCGGNRIRTAVYDLMGRATETVGALGVTTQYSYDSVGNLLSAVEKLESGDRETSYSYDILGRMTSTVDPMEGTTGAAYDYSGNLTALTDANGGTATYAYDIMGRLVQETSATGSATGYTYSAGGLLSRVKNARNQETAYEYDALGRVTAMEDGLGRVSYTYDAEGNVLTVTDGTGTITREYDALNRVTSHTDCNGKTIKYAYDEIGNLIALTYPGGETVRYSYYRNGLLHTVTDMDGNTTTYEYDPNGNMTACIRPNGTGEYCAYNGAGLLVEQRDVRKTDSGTVETITAYTYTYDESGNILCTEGTETLQGTGGISALQGAVFRYDADNRLVEYNGEEVLYDADGNMTRGPVNGGMTDLAYDCRNRLVSAGGVGYTYDAENNRISCETEEYVEEYVTDTVSAPLSRVLVTERHYRTAAGDSAQPDSVTLHVYGNGLVSEKRGGEYLYHHYNNLGSTMKLTDGAGNVLASYTYGAYGELLDGDTALTNYLYNGRCGVSTDANGLYYMRQRYYSPEMKRFVNQDILSGNLGNSQSLNRYSYVQGNPVSYTDPFGLSPLNGLFTGTGWVHGLLGLAGCIPGLLGAGANLVDALIYGFVNHDYGMAALSGVCAVTAGAGSIARMAAEGTRLQRGAMYVAKASELVTNTAIAVRSGIGVATTGYEMYKKYVVNEKKMGWDTVGECAAFLLNAVTLGISTVNLASSAQTLGKMLKEDNVVGKLTSAVKSGINKVKSGAQTLLHDNHGSVPNAGSKTSYGKSSGNYKSTADFMTNVEYRNGKYYANKATIDEIGQIEARGEDFSLLNKKIMSSRASTEGGTSIVYKYSDELGTKYLIHEVTDANGYIIHRDFDAVRISTGQLINKGH